MRHVQLDSNQSYTSSSYVHAIAQALAKLNQFEPVASRLTGDSLNMLQRPHAKRWWGLAESMALVECIDAVGGVELLRKVGKRSVDESISKLIRPLLSVLVTVSGAKPQSIFSRYQELIQVATRNVSATWSTSDERAGVLIIRYPTPMPVCVGSLWVGAFDFAFVTVHARPAPAVILHRGGEFEFQLSWSQ